MELSVGKRRGLAECATDQGVFSILALDHRNNLRNAMNPEHPERVSDQAISGFKSVVVGALGRSGSAVLVDPEFGAAQVVQSGAMPGHVGLVVAVEATGYTGDPGARKSEILEGWSVGKIRRMGASALKLLVYYHPDSNLAKAQEALVAEVAEACHKYDLAFFIEPLSYSLDPDKKLTSGEKRDVVIRTAETLTALGVDVLKAEFPVNVREETDENQWAQACEEVSQASRVPWVLLSAGVKFETYLRQLTIACQNGASGAMAGRAVWKEAVTLKEENLHRFLRGEARKRLIKVTSVCDALATPWWDFYPPQDVPEDWHQQYPDL